MNRRDALRAIAGAGLLSFLVGPVRAAATPPRVVFLNPGEASERGTGPFWRSVSRFMASAAGQLGMELEVLYAERDHLLMLRQADSLAGRERAPDYIVIVNEKMAAPQMLETLARSTAKVLVIHNDLTPEQRRQIGNERERIKNWIGTATADNTRGGYRLMAELHRQLGGRDARIIGITGDRSTPVSLERARGIDEYLERAGGGHVQQLAFGDWSYAGGEEKARVLLARYPDTTVIWAANDSMALGALRAVKARGVGVLVGGMGGWPDAVSSIAAGELAATAAGHDLIGAWAMVLLHDYHHGKDFAAAGGVRQRLDYLYVVNRANAARYDEAIFQHGDTLDFGHYSRVRHPRPGPYDFSVEQLVRTAKSH